mgnify:FL=1|jgi:hypothetical protein
MAENRMLTILDGVTGRPSDRTLSIEINLIDK